MENMWVKTKGEVDVFNWKGEPIHLKDVPAIKNKKTGKVRFYASEVAKAEIGALARAHHIEPRDVALLMLLYAKPGLFKEGEVHFKYHLNKMLFYQWKNMGKKYLGEAFPHDAFRPAGKGPIPVSLWDDLKRLEEQKIVTLDHHVWGKDKGEASLVTKLTPDGQEIARALWNKIPPELKETTQETKEQIFPLDPETIRKRVHREYPEFKKTYVEIDRE